MKTDTSKTTILVISTGFLLLYLLFMWQWAVIVSFCVGIIGIMSVYLSQKIEWIWMKIAQLLGYVVPNILLCIVFYLFLFPISVLYRIFRKDPLMLSDKYHTYFININKQMDKNSFEKVW